MNLYFDNAATSFPKPPGVTEGVTQYLQSCGAAYGRGHYAAALTVERQMTQTRNAAARLLGVDDPRRVIFTLNGTDSLNLAIRGICRAGDHVVTSTIEHNSVLRPLRWLQDHAGIEVTRLAPGPDGRLDPVQVRAVLRPTTRLVAIQHASNVTGVVQPIVDITDVARASGALCLVDAAQSAGHLPLGLSSSPISLCAMPGHKGLLGPLGTGLLYVAPGVEDHLDPLRTGGTGTSSDDDHQPTELPEKYEPGNHNVPGLIGLGAGLQFLEDRGLSTVFAHEQQLLQQLWNGLVAIPGVTLYGPSPGEVLRMGVVSCQLAGYDSHAAAAILDQQFGIAVRAGLMCAPGQHRQLGTFATGGSVRFSLGAFHQAGDVEAVLSAIRAMCTP